MTTINALLKQRLVVEKSPGVSGYRLILLATQRILTNKGCRLVEIFKNIDGNTGGGTKLGNGFAMFGPLVKTNQHSHQGINVLRGQLA